MIFVRRARQGGVAERKEMIDRTHVLPVSRQAKLLGVSRSSAYYQPRPVSDARRDAVPLYRQPASSGARLWTG
jgi:hypothetical protein